MTGSLAGLCGSAADISVLACMRVGSTWGMSARARWVAHVRAASLHSEAFQPRAHVYAMPAATALAAVRSYRTYRALASVPCVSSCTQAPASVTVAVSLEAQPR